MKQSRNILKERGLQIEGLTIRAKLTLSLLPVVLLSLVMLTVITTFLNQEVVFNKSDSQMKAILSDYASQFAGDIDTIKTETRDLSSFVGSTYQTSDISVYKDSITRLVESNEMILGSGIWFEPSAFNLRRLCGPYWYKALDDKGVWDGKISESWVYSDDTYDYLAQDYFVNAKQLEQGGVYMSEPYLDETSGLVMITFSAPVYSDDNKFAGCVTIDMMTKYIEAFFDSASVGKTGRMLLIDGNNRYVYHPDYENVSKQGITFADTKELSSYFDITASSSGQKIIMVDNKQTLVYWMSVPNTTWKLGLMIDRAEVFAESERLVIAGVVVCIVAVIFCAVVIIGQAYYFSRAAKVIAETLSDMSEGTFHKINKYANKKDEFGVIIKSTNLLVEKLSAAAEDVKSSADIVADSTEKLLNESAVLSESASAVDAVSKAISDGITDRKNKMDIVADRFDAFLRQFEALSINIEKVKDDSHRDLDMTVSFDTSVFDEIQEVISNLSASVKGASESVNVLNNIQLGMSESLEELSANLTQVNLLAMKSSAKAARFGDLGATTVALIDEISKLSVKSSEIVYSVQDEISQISSSCDDAMARIIGLSEIGKDAETAVSKLPDKIDIPAPEHDTVDFRNVTNSVRLCERSCIETHNAMKELMTLYEDNITTMRKSEELVENLDNAVEIIYTNTHMLQDSMSDLDDKVSFFKS